MHLLYTESRTQAREWAMEGWRMVGYADRGFFGETFSFQLTAEEWLEYTRL